jgi:hypothetical protein
MVPFGVILQMCFLSRPMPERGILEGASCCVSSGGCQYGGYQRANARRGCLQSILHNRMIACSLIQQVTQCPTVFLYLGMELNCRSWLYRSAFANPTAEG